MAYYRECPECGSNLDPGEKCECVREKAFFAHKLVELLETDDDGQIFMRGILDENVRRAM